MDAIMMFKEAAKALQSDPRFLALDAARKANDADTELQEMIAEFGRLNTEYQEAALATDADKEKVQAMQVQMNELYAKVMSNENMNNYGRAQQEAEKMIEFIGRIVTEAMNGGDPMLVQEELPSCCSGGCAGCSGCSGGC